MTITFKYKVIERQKPLNPIKCPIIPLTLKGRISMDYIGLLDSGADVSVIDKSIAELMGIDLSGKEDESKGVGGAVKTIESKIKIEFSKGHEKYDFEMPVLVLCDDDELGMLLLGRRGFFDKFIVTFDEQNQKFKLKGKDGRKPF